MINDPDLTSRAPESVNGRRFADLRSGGRALASRLRLEAGKTDPIVLAIVLGGAQAAQEVAQALGAPLDVIIIKKLLAPQGSASIVSAVNVAGRIVAPEDLLAKASQPKTGLDYFLADALGYLTERVKICRGDRPPLDLAGRTVVLVDCGVRTGMTFKTSVAAVRTMGPRRIVACTPVTSIEGAAVVQGVADEFVSVETREPFGNVAMWYKTFDRLTDSSISAILKKSEK
jgi:putative phosphoribosyl transferase